MRLLSSICISLMFGISVASAQTVVTIDDQAGAAQLVERHIFFNQEHGELPGYRIQIYSGNSLSDAKTQKADFLKLFEIQAYIIFESPNYKVRVGNYMNRFEANRDLMIVKNQYTDALIVKDLIRLSE